MAKTVLSMSSFSQERLCVGTWRALCESSAAEEVAAVDP